MYTSGFWPRVRARALRAPVFLGSLTRHTGRCAPHPPIAASAASYSTPKNKQNYRTRAARVKGFPEIKCFPSGSASHVKVFFLSTGPQRLWNMPPAPPIACSFADLSGNILGSQLCTGATFYSNLILLLSFLLFFSYIWISLLYNRHAYYYINIKHVRAPGPRVTEWRKTIWQISYWPE